MTAAEHLFDVDPVGQATPPHVVSARVSPAFRRELEAERARAGDEDLSATVRRLLRVGLAVVDSRGNFTRREAELYPGERADHDAAFARVLGDLDERPPSHAHGPATERAASRYAWPRAGSDRRRLIGYLYSAGDHGATSDEAVVAVGYSGQRRLHDLKRGGWAEVKRHANGQPVRRPTRRGALADIHVLTAAARQRVEAGA